MINEETRSRFLAEIIIRDSTSLSFKTFASSGFICVTLCRCVASLKTLEAKVLLNGRHWTEIHHLDWSPYPFNFRCYPI